MGAANFLIFHWKSFIEKFFMVRDNVTNRNDTAVILFSIDLFRTAVTNLLAALKHVLFGLFLANVAIFESHYQKKCFGYKLNFGYILAIFETCFL
jgi:hypothetical protein